MKIKMQQKLIKKAFKKIKSKFPIVELGRVAHDEQETWVDIIVPIELVHDKELADFVNEYTQSIREKYYFAILFNIKSPINY
ncbi:MAG: hypothetical protein OEV44_09445 [Spirochaetota bacterium]|nr:hypothetical protein [Spirochaetota bacterium]